MKYITYRSICNVKLELTYNEINNAQHLGTVDMQVLRLCVCVSKYVHSSSITKLLISTHYTIR